ncbi:tRNA preQ1(34) S-adenosylmethionine ribosyltransferase-isomerase QueA [Leadbettera azotonutricia]|uniref:S-adenosylmethionine:tRNA ribosyltransferase-isomerase n=1 Tax=Leadbettera azotonutricia (strain ATCC BAA-888 / DSM 13862 / ZAS-9) TaxID=545695 RepID=F5YC93_LEAAZ|nr:tRNA preQ1(34) S-adenosylmethionine ribosyltransferase-isomerase QueA [Leadbettera azotonutricia]AEF82985.1 S-adenosylmethionine:tRNA ribosyltransferase-isomerase [Leadbettera azotonutricia ZAS-9]
MKTSDFFFDLPENLIAQYPPEKRGMSRLVVLDRKSGLREHRMTAELPQILSAWDKRPLLVFNNSKVRKARLLGTSAETGAKAEFLLLNKIDEYTWKAMAQRAKRRHPGSRYVFGDFAKGEILAEDEEFRILRFDRPIDDSWLDIHGHIPLPPYIKRDDTKTDSDRYQTVYAQNTGSAAAPTAGLHFTREILADLEKHGMDTAFVTLHVGLGTFLPVRASNIEDHTMHEESFSIDEETAAKIEKAKSEKRPVLAVGTTSVRTLESAWICDAGSPSGGYLKRGDGATSIFIYPGYQFKVIDAMFTNFHTPGSTLLMLVSAFAGRELILETYREAVEKEYRFFSYGDAMLIK